MSDEEEQRELLSVLAEAEAGEHDVRVSAAEFRELLADREQARRIRNDVEEIKAHLIAERDEARRERDAYKAGFDAELAGNAALRLEHGAREDETMFDFLDRLKAELAAVEKERNVAKSQRGSMRVERDEAQRERDEAREKAARDGAAYAAALARARGIIRDLLAATVSCNEYVVGPQLDDRDLLARAEREIAADDECVQAAAKEKP